VKAAAELLQPLYERQKELVLQSPVLWTDDTPVTVLVGGEEGSRKGRFWTCIAEQHPSSVYDFTESRARDGPARFLSERTLRHQAIGRKNWLFLGSEQAGPRAAVLFTILAGVKRHHIEPWTYLREILLRLHADDPRLDEMLPDRWAAAYPEMVLNYRLEESRQKAACRRDGRRWRRARQRPK
jgi:hypothetical protein